ncbi:MAG TPA: 2Fe-2S iron-sulfur cluster-binding protein [Casimicrobiaceae bacterium]|nr:2Fe-2S iron-sulfur cluster-binding protein [Casimicrobiaceae bacterium]
MSVTQPFRLATGGGLVDRGKPLAFSFDGIDYQGFAGDTLASALLANGVHLVARSFKYHRPRGIFSAGTEEPNALVQLEQGAWTEPNVRATTQELYEGLTASSQNRWPSLRFDVGAINDAVSRILPAGFYYKTFMWPATPAWWMRYEHAIRHAAGMGRAATESDPETYEHRYGHCDVLVIGAGAAGLAAARSAASSGARVVLCDEQPQLHELAVNADVRLLTRTTAFGYYDQDLVGAVERLTDHLPLKDRAGPRQRLWKIRAKEVVLASGAAERGIAYAGNDRPGTMLAGAIETYVRRYAVRPGSRAVFFVNNDRAYASALTLHATGVAIAAIVDGREAGRGESQARARDAGIRILQRSAIVATHGRLRVAAVDVAPLGGGKPTRIDCDLVGVSGGFNPLVNLFSQARGTLRYDDALAAFVPAASPMRIRVVGAANGDLDRAIAPLWSVAPPRRTDKRFVDLQNDVTADDIALAAREGYQSVEHLKRYTTLGMGTDQGRTSNVIGLALLAQTLKRAIPDVGTTTFRPPYTPVTLGALPGHEAHDEMEPTRYSAMHEWHAAHGARFINAGLWKRPHSYPHDGESEDDAANREALNVRTNVGIVDVSTLGKIELQGRDVIEFLNRIYINRFDTLAVGRCRYGVMLRDDGIVLDDGTLSRLGTTHYLMTTTTVNAVRVMQQLEFLMQVEWPELDVYATSVTEQWSAAAISGPKSRDVVASVVDIDVSNAAFPFLAVASCKVWTRQGRIPARLFRISYSGELAYEIHVPSDRGMAMWEAVIDTGPGFGLMPYGTEAMSTLRIEKGHVVVGAEADGRTTADDLGMGKLVNAGKGCLGKTLAGRTALTATHRWQLVGLAALDGATMPRAAKIVADPERPAPNPMLGHVTSWCYSPNLRSWIALALIANGRERIGDTLWAVSPLVGAKVRVRVGSPCFIDEKGERLRG